MSGVLTYNGYSFDLARSELSVSVELVEDEAGRTVIYHRHRITVRTVVTNTTDGTNAELLAIRQALGEQGRTLVFTGTGFGNDLTVNASTSGLRDVAWGPKPRVISWEPIGSSNAAAVEWEVETCVSVCGQGGRSYGIMALNYDVTFAIDDRGYTTRTITGYLQIAQTRVGRIVPDCADLYRRFVRPSLPLGFRRSQSRTVSKDKSRLDFTIADQEIPSANAYPAGVVSISGNHRAHWSRRGGQAGIFRNSLSLSIELAADQPPRVAYQIFLAIAGRRIQAAQTAPAAVGPHVLLDELSADESLFSRQYSFTVGYRVVKRLSALLEATGMWTPIGTDWRSWALSTAGAFADTGYAGLILVPGNDSITDLCQSAGNSTLTATNQQQQRQRNPYNSVVQNQKPSPQNSWLRYDCWLETYRDGAVVRSAVMQTPDVDQVVWDPYSTAGTSYPAPSGTNDVLQRSGRSRYGARLIGYGMRAGYPIPRPRLSAVGAVVPVEIGGEFAQRVAGVWLGVPVYSACWSLNYALPNSPGGVSTAKNTTEF